MNHTIENLDNLIGTYLSQHPQLSSTFSLDSERVPACLTEMATLYLDENRFKDWLQDQQVFNGKSPLQYLSAVETRQLRENVGKIADAFYEVLGFTSGPPLPSKEELIYAVRLAQCQQLRLEVA